MKFLGSSRGLAVTAAILLALFLFRPGVRQLRNRISNSIGAALGRRVTIDYVRLRLLPRPGFDLKGFVIYDDPSFSAEPMIRAQEVSAAIRLRSLLRGRIEIATLSATEPSINIVRNHNGHWNLASLLQRNAQIPAAPTQKSASEVRPAFPYLEATHARINFKIGLTKKSWALTDADVALWQESENSWGARLRAQPVRTDLNLTDTGQIQVSATWQRAEPLQQTPMQVTLGWQKGQLGQMTQLFTGDDQGWRGSVDLSATLAGTPEDLAIKSRTAIEGFRRYNVLDTRNVRLGADCSGKYSIVNNSFAGILCESPVRDGTLHLRGSVEAITASPQYDLTLTAERVPVVSLSELWHKVKQQLPADLAASGTLNATFHTFRLGSGLPQFSGSGVASDVRLLSSQERNSISLGDVPLTLVGDAHWGRNGVAVAKSLATDPAKSKEGPPLEPHLRMGQASLTVNSATPMVAGGWISRSGYAFFIRGDTSLKNFFSLEDALGVIAARPVATGQAKVDLSVRGSWHDLASPIISGTAQMRNVEAEIHSLNAPIEISSAALSIAPDTIRMEKIVARIGPTHWTGEVVSTPRCRIANPTPAITINAVPECVFQFVLSADEFSAAELAEWFTPLAEKQPWYGILSASRAQDRSSLLRIQAAGDLHVARFVFRKLVATQVSVHLEAQRGRITLGSLRGQLLQGRYQGQWTIDASRQPPAYHGNGSLEDISLGQASALMNDSWISGTAEGAFDLAGSGSNLRDVFSESEATLHFVMHDGSFVHVAIPGARAPLPVHRFSGNLDLKKGAWALSDGRLESRDGIYRVTGTASPENLLDFVFTRSDEQSWKLTGTFSKPRVSSANSADLNGEEANASSGIQP